MERERRGSVFFDVANYSSRRARLHSISFVHRFILFCCCMLIGVLISMACFFIWQWRTLQYMAAQLEKSSQQQTALSQAVSVLKQEVIELDQAQLDVITQNKKNCSLQDITQACSLYHLTCKRVEQKSNMDIVVDIGGSFDGLFSLINYLADTYQICYQHISLSYDTQSKYLNATLLVRI